MLNQQWWFTALYTLHLLVSRSFEFEICIPIYSTPLHYAPLREDSPRVLTWELHAWVRQLRSGRCHYPTSATKCNVSLPQQQLNPVSGNACLTTKGGLLRYILYTYSFHEVLSLKFAYIFIAHRYSADTLCVRVT